MLFCLDIQPKTVSVYPTQLPARKRDFLLLLLFLFPRLTWQGDLTIEIYHFIPVHSNRINSLNLKLVRVTAFLLTHCNFPVRRSQRGEKKTRLYCKPRAVGLNRK